MSAHTPGPWRVIPSPECPWGKVEISPPPTFRYITVEGLSADQAEANARLIAAAPELLEALSAIIGDDEGANLVAEGALTVNHVRAARAAIAKAMGAV